MLGCLAACNAMGVPGVQVYHAVQALRLQLLRLCPAGRPNWGALGLLRRELSCTPVPWARSERPSPLLHSPVVPPQRPVAARGAAAREGLVLNLPRFSARTAVGHPPAA